MHPAGDLSDLTDAAGAYSIGNIPPGTYDVRVDNPPAGSTLSLGSDPTNTTLDPGETDNTIDFGYYQPATIGDFVFSDYDGDGVYEVDGNDGTPGNADDDTPLSGITVYVDIDGSGDLNAGEGALKCCRKEPPDGV